MSILDKYNLTEEQRDRVMTKVASTISELQKTDTLEKVALDLKSVNMNSPLAQAGVSLATTAAGTAIALGAPKLVDAIRAASLRRNKDEYIKAMKDAHPELKNVSQRDLDLAYNSMAMHSPGIIKDPLLGGQVMKEITGRAMRWDLNQYSTLNRTAGGGLADYEHNALQQLSRGVGNAGSVYYDASARKAQVDYQEKRDAVIDNQNKEKSKLEEAKFDFQRTSANRQYLQQKQQLSMQEARDAEQKRQFTRNFNANQADRKFSQDLSNKNYQLNRTNAYYNMGANINLDGQTLNKQTTAHNEAFSRAEADHQFQVRNQADINSLAHNQSYHKALGQSEAELKNNDRIMRGVYDKSYYQEAAKEDFKSNNPYANRP